MDHIMREALRNYNLSTYTDRPKVKLPEMKFKTLQPHNASGFYQK